MTARTIPEDPLFVNGAEREVWDALRTQLADDAVLLANLRFTDEKKDYEADLVVLLPGAGVVVLEVKGGSVWVDAGDGCWRMRRGGREVTIDPIEQVRTNRYAIRHYVEADPRWRDSSRSRIRWAHGLVVPHTAIDPDFAKPDCPRWMISGKHDLADLADRVRDVPVRQQTHLRAPDTSDVALIGQILNGRMLPRFDLAADAQEREVTADRLTMEQASLLRVTRLLHRVEVRGGAGSGKTVLALTQAKELTRGRDGALPQRVALICYSLGLSEFFRRTIASCPRKHRPAYVGPFEELARLWGVTQFADRDDSDFWERRLPEQMAQRARELPEKDRFDAIIVDEAQDFADLWWRPLMAALRDEEAGGLYVYSDENQRIFPRFGQPPVPLVPLVLDHNLRNTRQIADSFASLTPMRMRPRGGDGAPVRFVPCADGEAIEAANDEVDALLAGGWRPEHVALLTTGSRHPVQVERQGALGQVGYWTSFWEDDDVFYGHVLGSKGLERRAVVLCVNSTADADRAREKLYVGMSRATDELVVVGQPAVIRAVGGPDVARRLGVAVG